MSRFRCASIVIICLLPLAGGCAIVDNQEKVGADFGVGSTGTHLVMENGLDERIYYFAVGRQLSFLIDWAPHLNDERSVPPGETLIVSFDDIMMNSDTDETEVVVYWWPAAGKDGKRVPGDVETVLVRI